MSLKKMAADTLAVRPDLAKPARPVAVPDAAPVDGAALARELDGEPKELGDPDAYAAAALERAGDDLAQLVQGERNAGLNNAALSLGHLVGGGLLERGEVETFLEAAAERLWPDRDPRNVTGTIRSGLDAGVAQPFAWVDAPKPEPARPFMVVVDDTFTPTTADPATGEVVERSTWWPRDLGPILRGEADPEPAPAYLARQDGHRLFYAGKVNGLIGESESGKTWVALLAVAQALQVGERVLYLDFEDTAPGIVARLRALGVADRHLGGLAYVGPDESLHAVAERDLAEVMGFHRPQVVVLDGYNAAMTLLGLNLQDNTDVTAFSLRVLRPLKRTGACVITIDHVTKSKENRGSYAIGAQAKRADVDGCLLTVEVATPFGRGQTGRLKLGVSKDRPGHVRAISGGAKNAGQAVLISKPDGTVEAFVEGPDLRPADERGPFRPTVLMQRVSDLLERTDQPMKKTAIRDAVTGNATHIALAIDALVEDGHAVMNASSGTYTLVTPYADPSSRSSRSTVPARSFPVPGNGPRGEEDRSPVPPLYGGTGNGPDARSGSGSSGADDEASWWQK